MATTTDSAAAAPSASLGGGPAAGGGGGATVIAAWLGQLPGCGLGAQRRPGASARPPEPAVWL